MHRSLLLILFPAVLFCSCKKTIPLSSEKSITAFVFTSVDNGIVSDINGTLSNDTIYVKLPASADIHHLVPTISSKGKSLNPQDKVMQDFSIPVHYTVTAEDGSSKIYSVIVSYLSSIKEITSFSFKAVDNAGLSSDIDAVITGDTITALMPLSVKVNRLVATVTYAGVALSPQSKSTQDFSVPVQYTVRAEDGSIRNYIVQVSNNATVFTTAGNFVYALNATDGTLKWKYDLGYAASSVTYHNGVVFSSGYQNYLYAIDASTGKLKWKFANRKGAYTMCTFDNGMVFCGLNYSLGYMYMCAMNEETGELKWEHKFLPCSYCFLGNPVAADGSVYTPSYGGGIYAFDEATGNLEWQDYLADLAPGNPVVANGSVYFASEQYYVSSLDAKTGNVNWYVAGGGSVTGSLLLKDGIFYNSGYKYEHGTITNDEMYAIDSATRSVKWTSDANGAGGAEFSSPAVDKYNVYTNNKNGPLYTLSIHDGSMINKAAAIGNHIFIAAPVIANGTLYTCRGNNNFYAIDAATDSIKWIFQAADLFNTSPVILDVEGNAFSSADFGEKN